MVNFHRRSARSVVTEISAAVPAKRAARPMDHPCCKKTAPLFTHPSLSESENPVTRRALKRLCRAQLQVRNVLVASVPLETYPTELIDRRWYTPRQTHRLMEDRLTTRHLNRAFAIAHLESWLKFRIHRCAHFTGGMERKRFGFRSEPRSASILSTARSCLLVVVFSLD